MLSPALAWAAGLGAAPVEVSDGFDFDLKSVLIDADPIESVNTASVLPGVAAAAVERLIVRFTEMLGTGTGAANQQTTSVSD